MRAAIIVTVQFDERSAALLGALRRKHFPPALNRVGAHLTLFHNLPGAEEAAVLRSVAESAARTKPFTVVAAGPLRLGRGVAIKIESDRLMALRGELAARFKPWLAGQDREKFRPHVTIQNKVAPHEAAALCEHLAAVFSPFEATAEAIQLWRYAGGPWAPIAAVSFQGAG